MAFSCKDAVKMHDLALRMLSCAEQTQDSMQLACYSQADLQWLWRSSKHASLCWRLHRGRLKG